MDVILEEFADKAVQFALDARCQYCDVRVEDSNKNQIIIENGEVEYSTLKADNGIGIRVLQQGAWGFFSISNPNTIEGIKEAVEQATKNALRCSKNKKNKIIISNQKSNKKKINFPVLHKPDLDELVKIGLECDKTMKKQNRVIKSHTSLIDNTLSKYFTNSEGSKINQDSTDMIAELIATAYESGLSQSVNITEGGRGGIEKITKEKDIIQSAEFISKKSAQLIDAKPAKEQKCQIVMNPDFVGLLTHEILGHPSEADRVLGKEMAWAGGSWWAGKIGQKIGSNSLNVFDDPTIEGNFGWYSFDDEGIKASKTTLVENGILVNHLQNRETSEIFNVNPTANMRATSYKFMPLIRMACTCIEKGDWDRQEMIREIKNGYLISNMKIPSIDMKRYNWSISAQFAQKIENGELTDLVRDVIVMGTAPDFFNSIDACGKDFEIRPITNCGKGDPMQSIMMGNGGPSIRGTATIKSV